MAEITLIGANKPERLKSGLDELGYFKENGIYQILNQQLGQVDNTSDIDKPVSTATAQAILAAKNEILSGIPTLVEDSAGLVIDTKINENNVLLTQQISNAIIVSEQRQDNIHSSIESSLSEIISSLYEIFIEGTSELSARLDAMEGMGGAVHYIVTDDVSSPYFLDIPDGDISSYAVQRDITTYVCGQIWGVGGTATETGNLNTDTYTVGGTTHGFTEIFNSTWFRNNSNSHKYILSNTQDTIPPVFIWEDAGIDTVGFATNDVAGIVRGNDVNLGVVVDGQGQMHVSLTDTQRQVLNGNVTIPADGVTYSLLAPAVQQSIDRANEAYTGMANKVDKISGKGLSTNDFTNALKTQYDGYASGKADKATTLAGYGIINAYTKGEVDTLVAGVTVLETDPTVPAWAKASSKPTYTFSEITSCPTTLAGYGITDGLTASSISNMAVKNANNNFTASQSITGTLTVSTSASIPKIQSSTSSGFCLIPSVSSGSTKTLATTDLTDALSSSKANKATTYGDYGIQDISYTLNGSGFSTSGTGSLESTTVIRIGGLCIFSCKINSVPYNSEFRINFPQSLVGAGSFVCATCCQFGGQTNLHTYRCWTPADRSISVSWVRSSGSDSTSSISVTGTMSYF